VFIYDEWALKQTTQTTSLPEVDGAAPTRRFNNLGEQHQPKNLPRAEDETQPQERTPMKNQPILHQENQSTARFMKTVISSLSAVVLLLLSLSSTKAQDVDGFYNYIINLASQSGFNNGSLPSSPDEAYKESVDSYFWGLPLEETTRTQNLVNAGYGLTTNQLFASTSLNTSTTVVAPSEDLLYDTTFLNLPGTNSYVLNVPETGSTYDVAAFLNSYTDVTDSVGTRNFTNGTLGDGAGDYLVVGPNYNTNEALPGGIKGYIQTSTVQTWLIGRVLTDPYATATYDGSPTTYNTLAGGSANRLSLNNSIPLATNFSLTPLSQWTNGITNAPVTSKPASYTPQQLLTIAKNTPIQTGTNFLSYVGASVVQNGVPSSPSNNQLALYSDFSDIGLTTNGFTAPTNPATLTDITNGLSAASSILTSVLAASATNNSWNVNPTLGQYAASYSGWVTAAATAKNFLGANLGAEATYPTTTIDSQGHVLNGSNSYTLTFGAGQLPPVNSTNGWWSLTLYNTSGFIIPNSGDSYYGSNIFNLGSTQLQNVLGTNYGSTPITLYLSDTAPTNSAELPFWIPTPAGTNFELALRFYLSDTNDPTILDGSYTVPAVQEVPEPSSYALFGLGSLLLVLAAAKRRRQA